jgi:hypothetical protein
MGEKNSFAGIHARLIRVAAYLCSKGATDPSLRSRLWGLRDSGPIKGKSKFLVNSPLHSATSGRNGKSLDGVSPGNLSCILRALEKC